MNFMSDLHSRAIEDQIFNTLGTRKEFDDNGVKMEDVKLRIDIPPFKAGMQLEYAEINYTDSSVTIMAPGINETFHFKVVVEAKRC